MHIYWMEEVHAVIIGGGACGLMCAIQAGYLGKKVIVLEKNDKIGAKILISGGGRCNYMNLNNSKENFISANQDFYRSAFSQFTVEDTLQFFENLGIYGEEKTLGQLFPKSGKAKDIIIAFEKECKELGQELRCDSEAIDIHPLPEGGFKVDYSHNSKVATLFCSRLVLASGGLPIAKMGASDFSLRVAKKYHLNTIQTAPALVPLTITGKDEEWYASLSGNSIYCRVSNRIISFEENILFTHWGLSGPAILQISSYWRPGEKIEIDLLPQDSIRNLLMSERKENGKRLLIHYLSDLFPRKFADALGKYLPIEKNLASLTNNDFENLESLIHHFMVKPAGDKGYDKAEVMRGGVSTDELSSKTLESKKIPGLFFGGECVDVTGWLGGYNFQWALSSAFVIAQNL